MFAIRKNGNAESLDASKHDHSATLTADDSKADVTYYAHTAEDEHGNRLPEESGKWQPLADHLHNVSKLACNFATPLNLAEEATLAGMLHDSKLITTHAESHVI